MDKEKVKLDCCFSEFRVKYLVDICKEVIMTLTYYVKEDIRTRLRSSLDFGSQLETNLFPNNITWLRLGLWDITGGGNFTDGVNYTEGANYTKGANYTGVYCLLSIK